MSKNPFVTGKFIVPTVSLFGVKGRGVNDKKNESGNIAKVANTIKSAPHHLCPMVELFEATAVKY